MSRVNGSEEKRRRTGHDQTVYDVPRQDATSQTEHDRNGGAIVKEISTQTLGTRELERNLQAEKFCSRIHSEMTPQEISTIVAEEWPQKAFRVTKTSRNSITKSGPARVIFIDPREPADQEMRKIGEQVPGFQRLLNTQSLKMGDVAIIQSADTIVLEGETRAGDDMRTLLVGCVNPQEDVNALEEQLIEVANKIKNTAKERKELSVFSNTINTLRLRKLMECCFIDSGVNVKICAGRERNVGHLDVERRDDNANLDAPQQKEGEKYREDTRRKGKWKKQKGDSYS